MRDPPQTVLEVFPYPWCFYKDEVVALQGGARTGRDLFHHTDPFTTSKGDHIPAVCSPLTASSGWGEG